MKRQIVTAALLSATAAMGIGACGSSSKKTTTTASTGGSGSTSVSATISGAGSTFAAPIYQQFASNLKSKGLTVNYQAVGSGTGIADLQSKTVEFAGSDPALKSADRAGMKGPVFQVPVAFGAITVSYNLSGVKTGLKLTGPVLAEIFSGKITTWNDSAITALNPGVSLPSTHITVVHRADSSGTTNGFTKYLSAVSSSWDKSIGYGKTVKWPVGTGASGNTGVATQVKQTAGAIGYVEQAYALMNGFTYAAIKNGNEYVLPTIANSSAAAADVPVPTDLGISTIDSKSAGSYPITSQTFLVTYKDPCKSGGASMSVAEGLKEFFTYALTTGQSEMGSGSGQIPYAPLTSALAQRGLHMVGEMVCDGKPIGS